MAETAGVDPAPLAQLRIEELLAEVQGRVTDVLATRERMYQFLEAIVAVGSLLDLPSVLVHIAEAAVTLVGAQHGALGLVGPDAQLSYFITTGVTDGTRAQIGARPEGQGILGMLLEAKQPVRLANISEPAAAFGFAPHHPAMTTFLGVPICVRDEVIGELYLTEKAGSAEFDEEDERIVGALAVAAGIAIANAQLFDETGYRERWLVASGEVTTMLLSGSDPHEVLAVIAQRARDIADATVGLIVLPDVPDRLVVEVAQGQHAESYAGARLPVFGSTPGDAFSRAGPVTLLELPEADPLLAYAGPAGLGPVTNVPLGAPGAVRGVLVVARDSGGKPFGEAEMLMIEGFAAQAAIALELAERRRDAERLVVFEDRDRIARDLHDLVIQRLFACGMALQSVTRQVADDEVVTKIRDVVDDLDVTIKEIRSAIFELQTPAGAGAEGLIGRLRATASAAAALLGFMPVLQAGEGVEAGVTPAVADHVVAVVGELLTNAARHAAASRVETRLVISDGMLVLTVRDDGVGLPSGGRRSGLANVMDRAESLGGRCSAAALAEGGTQIVWEVPLS